MVLGGHPEVPQLRSMLFVPGNRTALVDKAEAAGADAIILDLEDAVPAVGKEAARREVSDFLNGRRATDVPVFVRINALAAAIAWDDLQAVVGLGLSGVLVPKVESAREVIVADRVLGWLEEKAQLPIGKTVIIPVLETARGARAAHEIGSASPRTAYMGGLGVRGGDVERSVGYRWSAAGDETYVMRSSTLLEVRAAGVPHPVSGMWADVKDVDGLAAFARQNRALGYEGMMCIHPAHVPVINAAFTPTPEELDRDRRLVECMRAAAENGSGATVFEGEMIDEAMVVTALARLEMNGGA